MVNTDRNCVDKFECATVSLMFLRVLKDATSLKMTKATGRNLLHWTQKERETELLLLLQLLMKELLHSMGHY